MAYQYFSLNGQVLPIEKAQVSLLNVEYSYGYGVYENIRLTKNTIFFLAEHIERLFGSAKIIDLEHNFSKDFIKNSVSELIKKLSVDICNIKILLIGGKDAQSANLYIMCLNPLFPDRKLYKTGAKCITVELERPFPHAKSLNMLPSYLAYKKAKQAGAYDALAVDLNGNITEGTRTNFFAIKGKTIYSPPEKDILLGVTRTNVINIAKQNGFVLVENDINLTEIADYDGVFLTSTSSKIMPIKSINNFSWPEIHSEIKQLIKYFDEFLSKY